MSIPAYKRWTDSDVDDHGDYILVGGNKLWRRGIYCPSEYFAHLCPHDRRWYWYIADDMRYHINNKAGPAVFTPKLQGDGAPTSRGYLVSLRDVSFIQAIAAPGCPGPNEFLLLSKKKRGNLAEQLFLANVTRSRKTERAQDLDGVDFIVDGDPWQVKHDGKGGYSGSGNLWVETHTVRKADIGSDY